MHGVQVNLQPFLWLCCDLILGTPRASVAFRPQAETKNKKKK
jgi:hypothetical protein